MMLIIIYNKETLNASENIISSISSYYSNLSLVVNSFWSS